MIYFIISGVILFIIKRALMRTKLFSRDLIQDLRTQVKEQQELIDYQTKKILELQSMVLGAGNRFQEFK